MIFWLTAAALALVVTVLMARALTQGGSTSGPESSDLGVYKDQLSAVDRDLARGVVTEDEAERLRVEIKRRLLDADRNAPPEAGQAPAKATALVAALCALVVLGGSLFVYGQLGVPGYVDMPMVARLAAAEDRAANRPRQAEIEAQTTQPPPPAPNAEFTVLVERLREAVSARPDDIQGLRLLARNEAGLGNFEAAAKAQAQLVTVLADDATGRDYASLAELTLLAQDGLIDDVVTSSFAKALELTPGQPMATYFTDLIRRNGPGGGPLPLPGAFARRGEMGAAHQAQARLLELLGDQATGQDHVDHADLLILAAGGYVSPEAEAALARALTLDPQNGTARYYAGLLETQTGRPDTAFQIWEALLREGPEEAPWIPPIRGQIAQVAAQAGIDFFPESITPGTGPTQGQIADAQSMSPQDRIEMIEGMVSGLAERLSTEGGSAEDWARLIRAYGVLGRYDAAATVWAEAQTVFPDDITRVPILQAARDAGVEQ